MPAHLSICVWASQNRCVTTVALGARRPHEGKASWWLQQLNPGTGWVGVRRPKGLGGALLPHPCTGSLVSLLLARVFRLPDFSGLISSQGPPFWNKYLIAEENRAGPGRLATGEGKMGGPLPHH